LVKRTVKAVFWSHRYWGAAAWPGDSGAGPGALDAGVVAGMGPAGGETHPHKAALANATAPSDLSMGLL
jgi:hypothetical protein